MFRKFAKALMVTVMVLGFTAPAFAVETMNLVFLSNTNDEEYDAALVLKNYVESRTPEIKIEIFAGSQLCGGPRECFEALDAGIIDIYVATAGGTAVVYPAVGALDLPYVFESDELVNELMAGDYPEKLRTILYDGTQGKYLMMAFSNTGGWRNYANAKHPFKTPADIKGLKLRTVENQVQMEQVRLHGGSPTPIPFMEVYTSLQTGVVDGTLNSITDLTNVKLHERAKYMTLDGHNYMFCMWFMATERFKNFSEKERDILMAGFDLMGRVQNGVQVRKELDAWKVFQDAGGEIYDPSAAEKAAFRKSVEPLRAWYLNEYKEEGKKFLDALDAGVVEAEKRIAKRHASILDPK